MHLGQAFVEGILMGEENTKNRAIGGDGHPVHDGVPRSK